MKRVYKFTLLAVGCLLLILLPSAQAANIHLRYFESVDVILTEERFQRYSFSALANEEVTVVAYGLDENVIPTLTVFDTVGSTLLDNPNPDGLPAVAAQFSVTENGIYTFLVSRQTDEGGLIRVMVFQGDPLTDDRSLLDTVDPLLPARAYLFAGNEADPVDIQISVVDDEDPGTPDIEVYAARGTDVELPPLEERTEPVTTRSWQNDNSQRIYTLNVRALPEPISHVNGFFSRTKQNTGGQATLQIDVNEGGEPEFIPRPTCGGFILENTTSFGGPNTETYQQGTTLNRGQGIEIVGENADFYLIVDPNSESGGTWIPKSSVDVPGLDSEDCQRVEEVEEPPLENEFGDESDENDEDLDDEDLNDDDDEDLDENTDDNVDDSNDSTDDNQDNQGGNEGGEEGSSGGESSTDPNWCSDPAIWGDGRCNAGSPEQVTWYWTCGWYLANVGRGQVPADCSSALPPLPDVPVAANFPGYWSGCNGFGPTAIVGATYAETPIGTEYVQLVTNYGSSYGSPGAGAIFHDTGQPSYPSFFVSGTLYALDNAAQIISTTELGSISCP